MKQSMSYGRKVNVEIHVYSECKYTASEEVFENVKIVKYAGLVSWDIVTGFESN